LNVNNLTEGGQESFPDLPASVTATASVLRQLNMRGIYNVLAADGPLSAFSAAVVASPWAASHYGGDPNHIAMIPLPPVITAPGTPPSPAPTPPPVPPTPTEEDVPYYATNSTGTGFIVATDLSSKTGIPDAADAGVLIGTGLYKVMDGQAGRPKFTDVLLNAIPTV
jgi:hypothetical protein